MTAGLESSQLALIRLTGLVAIVLVVFLSVVQHAWQVAWQEPEAVHVLIAPALIAILLWARRSDFRGNVTGGSMLGTLLLAAAMGVYAAARLRWCPEYVGRAALVPALAGAVACAAGWRVTAISVPALLILLLAVPPSSPYLPFLIVSDDPINLPLVQPALGMLAGTTLEVRGDEVFVAATGGAGETALKPFNHRTSDALLLMGYLSAAVFAASLWPLKPRGFVIIALLTIPVALACHLVRTLGWIAAILHELEGRGWFSARFVSAAVALALALGVLCLASRSARRSRTQPRATLGTTA